MIKKDCQYSHWFFLFFGLFLNLSCQNPGPTKSRQEVSANAGLRTAKVTAQTILIDARSPLKYALAHPSGAISMQWEEFSQKEAVFAGRLETDLYFHARRLARLGIGLNSEVLVIGDQSEPEGLSKAGRLAWTFRRMGISNTTFADINIQRFHMIRDSNARAEVAVWKPLEDESLEVSFGLSREELQKDEKIFILDLREQSPWVVSTETYKKIKSKELNGDCDLKKITGQHILINWNWRDLMSASHQLESKLLNKSIKKQDRIYVLDHQAIKSAGATLTLQDMGFSRASNWIGGSIELCQRIKEL